MGESWGSNGMELIFDANMNAYTDYDLRETLKSVGACDCNILFVHSDVMFGTLAKGLKRKEYLQCLYDALASNNVEHIVVPSFTYSFCNNEVFDVRNSRTSMGALNEYIRCLDGRYRTEDPLLSLSVPDKLKSSFLELGNHSLGENSAFDRLHGMSDVKFLFLGARLGNCFTYVHYIEKMNDVEYRFDLPFTGTMIDEQGCERQMTQYIHTACYGVKAGDYYYFEDELVERGLLKKSSFGNGTISCIGEKEAYSAIESKLSENIFYFLEKPYTKEDLIHKYTMGQNGERITHC